MTLFIKKEAIPPSNKITQKIRTLILPIAKNTILNKRIIIKINETNLIKFILTLFKSLLRFTMTHAFAFHC